MNLHPQGLYSSSYYQITFNLIFDMLQHKSLKVDMYQRSFLAYQHLLACGDYENK